MGNRFGDCALAAAGQVEQQIERFDFVDGLGRLVDSLAIGGIFEWRKHPTPNDSSGGCSRVPDVP
jgi:hypothetical protein